MLRPFSIIFIVLAVGLSGCGTSDVRTLKLFDVPSLSFIYHTPPGVWVSVSPELKQAFEYDSGSYWVYVDTTSGIVDSFSAYYYGRGTIIKGMERTERRTLRLAEYIGPKPSAFNDWTFDLLGNQFSFTLSKASGEIIAEDTLFYVPIKDVRNKNRILAYYDSLRIRGRNYYAVYKLKAGEGRNHYFWITLTDGIIKMHFSQLADGGQERVIELERSKKQRPYGWERE